MLLASIAIGGALSGGSAIADLPVAAAVLGVTTAILSGANAGLQPAEKAAEHRLASAGYGRIFRTIQRLLGDRENSDLSWTALRAEMSAVDASFDRIELEAPSVKPKPKERGDSVRRVAFVLTGEAKGEDQGAVETW